jgi:hypothetical protein
MVLIFYSCQTNYEPDKDLVIMEINKSMNPKLREIVKEYYLQNLLGKATVGNKEGMVTISVEVRGDTSIMYISSIISRSSLLTDNKGFYFFSEHGPVVVYAGLENILEKDSFQIYKNNLAADTLLIDDLPTGMKDEEGYEILDLGPNYNPVVWKIVMVSGNIINKENLTAPN